MLCKRFAVGEVRIEVCSQNEPLLEKLTMALGHIGSGNDGLVNLRIEICTGAVPEQLARMISTDDTVTRLQTDEYRGLYNPGGDDSGPTLSWLDSKRGRAIFWLADARAVPWYQVATPFRIIFHWFFKPRGWHMVHSASVGNAKKGILLVGKGGSGKTSTALSVLREAGLSYVADDYILLRMEPEPVAWSLYGTAKVERHDPSGEKTVLFPYQTHAQVVVPQLPVSAIVLPVIARQAETTWECLGRAQALLALAPSTIFQLRPEDTREDSFTLLADLVKKVPAWQLRLGTEPGEIGQKLTVFLNSL